MMAKFIYFFALVYFFTLPVFSQSQTEDKADSSALKALYIDINPFRPLDNIRFGLSFVTTDNWIISGHLYNYGEKVAPQKPEDYVVSTIQETGGNTGGGSGGGGGLINLNLNFGSGSSGNSAPRGPNRFAPNKIYKIQAVSFGRVFPFAKEFLRIRSDAGIAFLKIDEAHNFVFVEGSVQTNPSSGVTTTITDGYTFSRHEYRKTGALLKLGLEIPFTKYLGMNAGVESILSGGENLWGFSFGIMLGILK